jgi:CDP-6-deoxy-D-xylo-4-hexulose-3-dehydrase
VSTSYELAVSSWGAEEAEAVRRSFASGRTTMGESVAAFEREFAAYHGKRYAVMVNSGSSANLLAVASLCFRCERPLRRGDEVLVPAVAWGTTYHPLQQYGLKMRILDVERDTLNIDVSRLEAALTPRTRAVVVVNILGNPAALDVLRAFCDRHGLYLIEDNCESLDAELGGRKAGSFGDVGTFSLFFSHHISTGEGGLAVTDDEETCHLLRALRAHGWTRDLPADSPVFEPRADDFFEAYRFILPGYNVRPMEFQGAVGRVQLAKLPLFTQRRRDNMALFRDRFAGDSRFLIQRENGRSSSFAFTIVLNPNQPIDRRRALAALKAAGIGFRIITGGCILRHDVMRHYDFDTVGGLDNAMLAHDRGFFVGNAPVDLSRQIDSLYRVLDEACS